MNRLLAACLVSIATIGTAQADEAYQLWSETACAHIAAVYSKCGRKFDFANGVFKFRSTLGNRDIRCSDGRRLEFYDRLEAMDVASILMIPYASGPVPLPEVRKNHDPGRLRSDDLFAAVYGGSREETRANLVKIPFLNQVIAFQKRMGAANALEKIGVEILAAAKNDAELAKFVEPFTSGKIQLIDYTIAWRVVKGTSRLSTHSFGTGIDLHTGIGPAYWLWDMKKLEPVKAELGENAFRLDHYKPARKPIMPQKIVDIFERNGFIWGGKWNHYDTMHFEYRPEFYPDYKINCPN